MFAVQFYARPAVWRAVVLEFPTGLDVSVTPALIVISRSVVVKNNTTRSYDGILEGNP